MAVYTPEQIAELMAGGLTAVEVIELVKVQTVSTVKTATGKKEKIIPITAVNTSASALNSEKLMGGITTAKFIDWNGLPTIVNQGYGGKGMKWGDMFCPLSQYEGKVIPEEAIARIDTAIATMAEHLTVLEATKDYISGLVPVQVKTKKQVDLERKVEALKKNDK